MHLIRRSAFRAISSPSISFLAKPRSISTSSPFVTGKNFQATPSSIFRRFASNDVGTEARESDIESTPFSEDESSVTSPMSSAIESASDSASERVESLIDSAWTAKDEIIDGAADVAASAGLANTMREDSREHSPRQYDAEHNRPAHHTGPPDDQRYPRDLDRMTRPSVPTNSLYVGNLLFETTEEDLQRAFGKFGEIRSISIARDARNLSKGFGYVRYQSVQNATEAIHAMNQSVMDGRRIVVNYQVKTSRDVVGNPPSRTLFIGNLAFEMSDADLNKLFRDIKNVMDVRVAIDRRTGQPRGFAHADFVDTESATKALEYLQGRDFYGRVLRIDYAGTSRKSQSIPSSNLSGSGY